MKLIDNAWAEFKRLWSVRVAAIGVVFWSAITGLYYVWPAFAGVLPLWFYAIGGVVMSILIIVARLTHQPGSDEI